MSDMRENLIRKIKLHIFHCITLKWISKSSSIEYNLTRLICKRMYRRTLIITTKLCHWFCFKIRKSFLGLAL